MPTIIHIAERVTNTVMAKINTHLQWRVLFDSDWAAAEFVVVRDECTWIEGSQDVRDYVLLNAIQHLIDGDPS